MGEVMKMRSQPIDLKHEVRMDPAQCRVRVPGHEYTLTQQEYLLFDQLLRSAVACFGVGLPVCAVSRGELLRGACTVDVHVQRLRAKMGSDVITTVYRRGYCLNPAAIGRLAMAS